MTSPAQALPFVSLRARMTIGFTVAFGILMMSGCLGIIAWSRYTALRDAQEQATTAVSLLGREWDTNDSQEHIRVAFDEVREDQRLASVSLIIVDLQGKVIAANHRSGLPWPHHRSDGWIIASAPYGKRTAVAGVYWPGIENAQRQPALLLLAFGLLVTVVVALLAWVFVGWTLRPIAALSEQARVATKNPLQAELVPSSSDTEIRLLVSTLNAMLEQLREDTRTKEQFYAAAAHELRTPLAVLFTNIEVMLTRRYTVEEYDAVLADLLQQTRRLITLTESILLLNRLEMGTDWEESESVDLADVCERMLSVLQPTVLARELSIVVHLSEVDPVEAPPTHVLILLRNLIENAVRYTPVGGQIVLSITEQSGESHLHLYNDCVLPEDLELEKLFIAFYRADTSRNTKTGGNGLGLAICKALAERNGWLLALQREAGGICASVIFKGAS